MKQYCRYCVYLCVNNAPYCDAKKQFRSESSCKRPNNCKDFILCEAEPEYQDAFGETKGYKERKPKAVVDDVILNISVDDILEVYKRYNQKDNDWAGYTE